MWVRPWNEPWNTMMFGRRVTCLASLTAASVISAPELAKKKVSIAPGAISESSRRQRLGEVVGEDVDLGVDEALRLGADRRRHLRVGVARGVDGDAGREVEVLVAAHGGDPAPPSVRHLQVGDLEPHVRQVRHAAQTTTSPSRHRLDRAGVWLPRVPLTGARHLLPDTCFETAVTGRGRGRARRPTRSARATATGTASPAVAR